MIGFVCRSLVNTRQRQHYLLMHLVQWPWHERYITFAIYTPLAVFDFFLIGINQQLHLFFKVMKEDLLLAMICLDKHPVFDLLLKSILGSQMKYNEAGGTCEYAFEDIVICTFRVDLGKHVMELVISGLLTHSPYDVLVELQEFDNDSASSQVFWLLKESELTPSSANILDGRYTVFGYVTENQDLLADLKVGDVIESIRVTNGLDNLVNPSYKVGAA